MARNIAEIGGEKMNTVLMSLNIDIKIKGQIRKIAKQKGLTMTALIHVILSDYLEERKRKSQ